MAGIGKGRGVAMAGIAAVALLALTGIWWESTRPVTEPVRLANGTRVRVRSMVVGRELYSPYDNPLARLVGKLPDPLRSAVGRLFSPAMPAWTGPSDALGLWLESDGLPATTPTAPRRESEFLVFLNDGRPFRIDALARTAIRLPDGRQVEGHFFPMPPATVPEVAVSVFSRPASGRDEPETQSPQTRWTLRPPPRPSPPAWVGMPLPQRQTSEGLEVVLTTLKINADWRQGGNALKTMPSFLRTSPRAQFELWHLGRPATNWQVERVRYLKDASGGKIGDHSAYGHFRSWMNGSNYVQWRASLWPGQVWKLGVEFTRVSGFSNTELVTFTNLVPGVPPTNSLSADHGTVVVKRVHAWEGTYSGIDLELGFQPSRLPARLTLLSFTDAKGTSIPGFLNTSGDLDTTYSFERASSSNAPFTATFALQLGRVLEFTAEPEVGVPPPSEPSPAAAP
ncbi:MAG: hypothetical protein JNL10_00605 [Verrucomicrobiales bacterium]|nr:hypothetical protein [Verrucomicrobiales bacterium]